MFNEYEVFQMVKLRQEETERNAKDTWKHYIHSTEENNSLRTKSLVNPCCQCACN